MSCQATEATKVGVKQQLRFTLESVPRATVWGAGLLEDKVPQFVLLCFWGIYIYFFANFNGVNGRYLYSCHSGFQVATGTSANLHISLKLNCQLSGTGASICDHVSRILCHPMPTIGGYMSWNHAYSHATVWALQASMSATTGVDDPGSFQLQH